MAGWTNRGKLRTLEMAFRGRAVPTNYYLLLATSATAPTDDTNVVSDMTEIAAGNGYVSGGFQLSPGAVDFDTVNEDDAGDLSSVQIKDATWTASGGSLPASGSGARYALLTDDNAIVADREVYIWFDLQSDRVVSDGQPLTIQDCDMRLT